MNEREIETRMRRLLSTIVCMICLMCISAFASCNAENAEEANKAPEQSAIQSEQPTLAEPTEKLTEDKYVPVVDTRPKLSVLFIGNSYTYYNNMPTTFFRGLATKHGYRVTVETVLSGGYTLEKFADPDDEQGKKVAKALDPANAGKYDFVILQEQSMRPALDNKRESFFAAVRDLSERIRAIGAEPILYSTWGRKEGSEDLEDMTNESMTWRLAAAYSAIGEELGIKVAHVGLAFFDVYTNNKDIELYDPDKTHPSYEGSYLAAATLFDVIFDASSAGVDYNSEMDDNVKSVLDEAARKSVFDTPEIPEEYVIITRENTENK